MLYCTVYFNYCAVQFTLGCKKWDTCAPEAILHAMGGKLTDMKGQTYQYHSQVTYLHTSTIKMWHTDIQLPFSVDIQIDQYHFQVTSIQNSISLRWHAYIPVPFSGDILTYQCHSQVTCKHTSTILSWHPYIPVPFSADILTYHYHSQLSDVDKK